MKKRKHHHQERILSIAAYQQNYVFSLGQDQMLLLWDVQKRKCLYSQSLEFSVDSLVIHPNNRELLIGTTNGTIHQFAFDVAGKLPSSFSLQEKGSFPASLSMTAIHPNGKWLLTTWNRPKLWDIATGTCIQEFFGHQQGITAATFSGDGSFLFAAGAFSEPVLMWETTSGNCIGKIEQPEQGYQTHFTALACHPVKQGLVLGTGQGKIYYWNFQTKSLQHQKPYHYFILGSGGAIRCLLVDQQSDSLFVGHVTGHIYQYDFVSGNEINHWETKGQEISFHAEDNKLIQKKVDTAVTTLCQVDQTLIYGDEAGNVIFLE